MNTSSSFIDQNALLASEWISEFPEYMDEPEDSYSYMSRLLYVTFTHVLESRKLMPPNTFEKCNVNNDIKTYVMNLKTRLGVRMACKFAGAADAMRKGFLDQLMIVVSNNHDDPLDAVEVFSWKMMYNNDGTASAAFTDGEKQTFARIHYKGPEMVKKQTRALLSLTRRICRELLAPLTEDSYATLRITYTDMAPRGYQADGFHRAIDSLRIHPNARDISIGGLAVGFHKCLFSAQSIYVTDPKDMESRIQESRYQLHGSSNVPASPAHVTSDADPFLSDNGDVNFDDCEQIDTRMEIEPSQIGRSTPMQADSDVISTTDTTTNKSDGDDEYEVSRAADPTTMDASVDSMRIEANTTLETVVPVRSGRRKRKSAGTTSQIAERPRPADVNVEPEEDAENLEASESSATVPRRRAARGRGRQMEKKATVEKMVAPEKLNIKKVLSTSTNIHAGRTFRACQPTPSPGPTPLKTRKK